MKQWALPTRESGLHRPHAERDCAARDGLSVRRLNAARRQRRLAKISTVLVPSDLSEKSFEAVPYAAALAKKFGARLHFVHVSEIDFAAPDVALVPGNPVVEDKEVERALAQQFEQTTGGSVSARFHERTGRAFDQICRLSTEIGADLIVMSTHGRTGLKRLFLGSNAERVVQHSSVPVLVVRLTEREFLDEKEELHIRTIVVPTDFSASSGEGLNYALNFARPFGARLVLFHSFNAPEFVTMDGMGVYNSRPTSEYARDAAKHAMREFVKKFDFGGVEFETRITMGGAADGICDYAGTIKADLIITSTHGRTGFMHVVIGSVAEHVVRHAGSPVLVVPGSLKQK